MKRTTVLLFSVLAGFQLLFWAATHGLTGAVDLGEAFCVFNAGKNFDQIGFANLKGLQDDATSPDPAAHPHSYTHQPMFPVYLSFVLHRAGLRSFAQQSLAVIPFFLLGLWFCYLFLRRRLNWGIAICVIAVSLLDLVGTLSWGSHLFRAFSWPLFWGAFLAKERWQESLGRKALLLGVIALCFYFEWSFAGVVLLALWADEWIQKGQFPKRLFWWGGLAGVASILLRMGIVGNAIGWGVLFEDFKITVSNRLFGTPSWSEVRAFYEKHHFSLWGFQSSLSLGFLWDSLQLFYTRVKENLGVGTLEINALLIPLWFLSISTPLRRAFQLYAAIFIGVLALWILSPLYMHHAYIHPFFPLFVFPLNLGKALFILSAAELMKQQGKWVLQAGAFALLCIFGLQLSRQTWFPLPSTRELAVARGKSILTNYHGWYAAAMTGSWAGTSWGRVSEGSKFFHKHYVLERNKNPDAPDQYDFPDFVLCLDVKHVNQCAVDGDFFKTYPLVREGRGFALFDVRSRAQFRPLQREGRWVVANAEWAGSRQVKEVALARVEHPLGQDEFGAYVTDGNPMTEWTLELPPTKRLAWGLLDPALEATVEVASEALPINVLAVQASAKEPQNIFQSLRLLGSQDKEHWEQVTFLVRPALPNASQWTTWEFDNEKSYRYLRLILAPAEGQSEISLAEIKWVHSVPKSNLP